MSFIQPAWWAEGRPLIWDSGYFAVAANTTYTKTHGLNVQPIHVEVWFSESATGGAENLVNWLVSVPNYGASTTQYNGCYVYNVTKTQLSVRTAPDNVGLTGAYAWASSGYYRVLVWG